MRKILLLLMIASVGMAGCANPNFRRVDPTMFSTSLSEDEAAIVFLRQNRPFVASGTEIAGAAVTLTLGLVAGFMVPQQSSAAPVFEVEENGNLKFVAVVKDNSKFLHKTTPGRHLYFTGGENFLEADLEAGKTYYAYISMRYGGLNPRYVFIPVTASELSSEKFQEDFAKYDWYENTPLILKIWQTPQNPNISRVEKMYSEQIRDYPTRKTEDKVLMLPEYGANTPIQ